MVPLLVLLTVLIFFAVQWHLENRREAAQILARSSPFDAASRLFVHPGHTWARPTTDGLVSVGSSEFAWNFTGAARAVELPRPGARLRQGQPAWTLVSKRGRRLPQPMPIDGKVIAVNDELKHHPDLAQRSPLDAGWVLRVRPRRLASGLRNLLHGGAVAAWHEAVRSAATARLQPALGHLAQDGGHWVTGFGDELDEETWDRARLDLFPTDETERDDAQ
jgi:glycine cleavage system H protein